MSPSSSELLTLAHSTAEEAAALVRARRAGQVEVTTTKSSPIDIVTETDRESEQLIRGRLLRARPDDGFLGEESGAADSTSGVTWVVDPIDGTVNFLYDIPQYAVSIAAAVEGEVVAGVVVDVASQETFCATAGGGATRDGTPIAVGEPRPEGMQLVGTGFSYRAQVRAHQASAVADLVGRVRDVRRLGSAALDLCYLAAGRLDGYAEEALNEWDLAAGRLVAREAGARVETRPGAGGTDLVVAAPSAGFDGFSELVRGCGFTAR